jgi:hypothetical protein
MEDSHLFNIEKSQKYKVKILDENKVGMIRCEDGIKCKYSEGKGTTYGTWDILFNQALLI